MSLRRLVLLGTVAAIAVLCVSTPASAATGSTPTTARTAVALDPKVVVSIVKVAAYAPAVRVAAVVGTPSCPAGIKPAVGLTFQCLVPFDKTPVAFLVTIGDAGALDARPTFPVVSLVAARALAGVGATCGVVKAKFVVLPIGATLPCTIGTGIGTGTGTGTGTTVTLRVTDQYGTLTRVPTR